MPPNPLFIECPMCGTGILLQEILTAHEPVVTDRGESITLHFKHPGLRCRDCDYETLAVSQAGAYMQAFNDALAQYA